MKNQNEYVRILNEELVVAMGCTEPIAIAYCASLLKDALNALPEEVDVLVSRNIIKNVKSVIVPNTNRSLGIETTVAIGLLAGDSEAKLSVIANASKQDVDKLPDYVKNTKIKIAPADNDHTLYIELIGRHEKDTARAIIMDGHTKVHLIEKNGEILFKSDEEEVKKTALADKNLLNVKEIIEFGKTVPIEKIEKILNFQIECNMAIAKEGIENDYGANVGKTLLKYGNGDIVAYCKALASAASDARMNGCEMPVVINSGSGNQGITCSVPVVAYAQKSGKDREKLLRALAISNLITIHIKNNIGKLSAFCGVVIAGVGAGAGICFLEDGDEEEISHTIVNALAINSGIVCDGAKSSCAAKIASSVEAGILGYYMYKEGNQFLSGEGIVKKGVENTIKAVGELARVGMCETDKEIIHIMLDTDLY